jgi:hypothetical protein
MHDPSSERVVELPATAAAASLARREIAATPGLGGELGYKALLLSSELVAVFVAGGEPRPDAVLRLTINLENRRVRIEVRAPDRDVAADELLHSQEAPSLGGMGLQIVERIADAWGVENGDGAAIWFELMR